MITKSTEYKVPSFEEQVIKDFLIWCGREKGAVLVDITRPDVNNRTSYKFIDQMEAVEEYLRGKE